MAGQLDLVEGQTTLGSPESLNSGAGESAAIVLWMVWNVELFARIPDKPRLA
jgi:hypothetical protein